MATEATAAFLARRKELGEHVQQSVSNPLMFTSVYVPSGLAELIEQHRQQEAEKRRAGGAPRPLGNNPEDSEDIDEEDEDDMDADPDFDAGGDDDDEEGVDKVEDPIISSNTGTLLNAVFQSAAQAFYCDQISARENEDTFDESQSIKSGPFDICICVWNVSNTAPKLVDEEMDCEGELPEMLPYGGAYFLAIRDRIPNSSDVGHILYLNSSGPLHPDNCITVDQVLKLLSTKDERLMDPSLMVMLRAIIVDHRMGFIPDNVRRLMAERCIACPAFTGQYTRDLFIERMGAEDADYYNNELAEKYGALEECEALLRSFPECFFQPRPLSEELCADECVKFGNVHKNIMCEFSKEHLALKGYFDLPGVKAIDDALGSDDMDDVFVGFEVYVPSSIFKEEFKVDDEDEFVEDNSDFMTECEEEEEEEEGVEECDDQ